MNNLNLKIKSIAINDMEKIADYTSISSSQEAVDISALIRIRAMNCPLEILQ